MEGLPADSSRLIGHVDVAAEQEATAAIDLVRQMRPKKSNAHTLQKQAVAAVAAADSVCRAITGAPVNSTIQLMSAAVRSSRMNFQVVNTTGDAAGAAGIAPSVYEQDRPIVMATKKPCSHCGETFDGPPFMIRVPHPDKRKTFRMWGNFCGPSCMVGFTAERNDLQGLETAYAWATAREVYGVKGDIVTAPPSWAMRAKGGPFAPQPCLHPTEVRQRIRGARFIPEGAMFTCATRNKREGSDDDTAANAMDGMSLMFARNGCNPQGLRRPPPQQRPQLAPRRVRPSMARQFRDAVKAGMKPEDITVDLGLERRDTVSIRRSNIGTVPSAASATTPAKTTPASPPPRKRRRKAETTPQRRRHSSRRAPTSPKALVSAASTKRMALGVRSARSGGTKRGALIRKMHAEAMRVAVKGHGGQRKRK